MKYKVGDSVVHLSHGIGIIKNIEEREFSPEKLQKFYVIEVIDNGAPKKVFVPFENSPNKLRSVMDKNQAKNVLEILKNTAPSSIDHQTWNRRYKEYMELIHTGEGEKIAEVLRSINQLSKDVDLSFGERKLMEQAIRLLVTELSVAMNWPETYTEQQIHKILN